MSYYSDFHILKNQEKEAKKKARSPVTLQYYNKIVEMLESTNYAGSSSFLYSVQQYIEQNEFISDKQMEKIDIIYSHPDDGGKWGQGDPFN